MCTNIAGAKDKISQIVIELKKRSDVLKEYYDETLNTKNNIRVEKLNEILTYLLKIAYFPMEPAKDTPLVVDTKTYASLNIAGLICKILENGNDCAQI